MYTLSILEDYVKFLKEVTRPIPQPQWTTGNKIELELKNVKLRKFSDDGNNPSFIVPPQAGHHSNIADYGPGQSLVQAVKDSGNEPVYVASWQGATLERRNETIDDFIESMDKCIEHIGEKVNLIGLCQGGWQSAIYTALYPEKVKTLTLAAAPVDFRAGKSKIQMYVDLLDMDFYKYMVKIGSGNMAGKYMVCGFKMLNPFARFYKDFKDLYDNINDEKYVKRYRRFRDWYEWTQNLPGAMYLQIVEELFKGNKLIKGTLEIQGTKVDLKNIKCPLFLIAGEKDDITLEEQLFNMEHYVSSEEIMKLVVPAGHIGVFMGGKVLREYWPKILGKF